MIEPGEGICHEPKESRSRMAGVMWRGHDAGIVARTEPGEASRRVIPAVNPGTPGALVRLQERASLPCRRKTS